jgi:opacity protein-like surface antigen
MSFDRVLFIIAATALTSGCHWFNKVSECHKPQEYQHAGEAPPLKVPAGLDSPNTQGALVIPATALAMPPPGPNDPCLDSPPRYVPAPSSKAASGVAAVAVPPAADTTAAAAAAATPASALFHSPQAGDWEFRIGPVFGLSQNIDFPSGSADIKNTTGIKTGVDYFLTEHLTLGGNFSYSRGDFSSTVVDKGVTVGVQNGHESASTLLFDGRYSFLHGPLRPYLGAGLGYTWVNTNIASGPPVAGCWWDPWWGYVCTGYQPTRGTSSWAGQLGAGVQYDFNHQFGVSAGYLENWLKLANKSTGSGALEVMFNWRFLGN